MNGLASRRKSIGKIYALIGPNTFSSAVLNAEDFKTRLGATLVGEATGGVPGGYGEIKPLTLPHSKLVIWYTSKFFGNAQGGLPADRQVRVTLADVLAGRDPVFDATQN